MSQILDKLHKVDPNDSDAVKEVITGFFQNVTKHTEINCNVWLRGLEKVIIRFPRYCAQHRSTIEKYLVHFLAAPNLYNVIEAAKCAHALQQIRPSQDKAATAKNCWREQMSVLCEAAHRLMDVVFSSAGHPHGVTPYVQRASYPLLGEGPLARALTEHNVADRSSQPLTKLRNVLVFIQAMLVEVYPVGKPVAPRPLLELIVRLLSAGHAGHDGHDGHADVAHLKVQALRTLDALVACLGSNLIPLSALVVRCAMQTLRWSSDRPGDDASVVRCAAYRSLCAWVCVAGACGGTSGAWHHHLCAHVARDVTTHAHVLQLTMSSQYSRKLSKKARRKLTNSQLQTSGLAAHAPGNNTANTQSSASTEEVSVAALECVEVFLTECGDALRPALLAMLQERLVRAGYALVTGTEEVSSRRALCVLRALRAARAPHHLLQLCTALRHSACHQMRKFCSQTLLELKLQLHGSPPSLSFALDPPITVNHSASKALRISKKNRAALDSLLGKQRYDASLITPSSDEVITITDEPSSKRPRLESQVISDNISVSSDSVESLGSTDDNDLIVNTEEKFNQLTKEGADAQANVVTNNVEGGDHISERVEGIVVDDAANMSQTAVESEQTQIEVTPITDIYEAKTQIPLNISTDQDTVDDEESPLSMEIVYDPNTESKVTVLERIDDDTLPSTNDTDDVQITCGQVIKNSQDFNVEGNKTSEETPKLNGVSDAAVADTEHDDEVIKNIEVNINTKEITVDDMLADFVDEPIEEATAKA